MLTHLSPALDAILDSGEASLAVTVASHFLLVVTLYHVPPPPPPVMDVPEEGEQSIHL